MKIYEKEIELYYYDVDRRKQMTPVAILKAFSEVAATHNDLNSGQNVDKQGYGWMLNKWSVKILKYPEIYDKIVVKTWVSKIDRFFVNREFSIENQNGEEIIQASSIWIFMDMVKRRPTRLNEDLIDYSITIDKSYNTDFERVSKSLEMENSSEFIVRRNEIDLNQHVNNLVYFDWVLENVPEEIYFNKELKYFEIDYKKEIIYPNTVVVKNTVNMENDVKTIHGIFDKDGNLSSTAVLIWK